MIFWKISGLVNGEYFSAIKRAELAGTEMERLAGEMNNFALTNETFGFRLSTAKLFHTDGTPRERYLPTIYIKQSTSNRDEILEIGIELIIKMTG